MCKFFSENISAEGLFAICLNLFLMGISFGMISVFIGTLNGSSTNAIAVAVKQLVHPVSDKEGNAALKVEVERCRRVLEDLVEHEDALNAAAESAAETLLSSIDTTGISHSKDSGTLSY